MILKRALCLFVLTITLLVTLDSTMAQTDEFNLDAYKGRVVYLDFWASWCSPCRQSFPFMNELKAKYEDQGLSVVSINVDQVPSEAAEFLVEIPADFEVIYDSNGVLAEQHQLQAMPTSFLYDRSGELVGTHLGFKEKDIEELTLAIEATLQSQ